MLRVSLLFFLILPRQMLVSNKFNDTFILFYVLKKP